MVHFTRAAFQHVYAARAESMSLPIASHAQSYSAQYLTIPASGIQRLAGLLSIATDKVRRDGTPVVCIFL